MLVTQIVQLPVTVNVSSKTAGRTYHVLILIHDDYAAGGLQRSAVALSRALAAHGHDAQIYCMQAVPGGYSECFDFVRPVTSYNGAKVFRWIRFFRDWRALLRSKRWDVAIGLGVAPSVLIPLTCWDIRNVRTVGSERVYPPAEPPTSLWRGLRRLAYPLLDKIVCQTQPTLDWFANKFALRHDRLTVIPNIVDLPRKPAKAHQQLQIFEQGPVVAAIGRMEQQKGLDYALSIFGKIAAKRSDARFVIAGDGPLYGSLASDAASADYAERLLFRPRFDDLSAVWPHVDVFLLPSRYEGFPNALAEAMAHGVPCVAFDCPTGPSDLITDGHDGFLVPVGDCGAAAVRCLELLEQPSLRRRIGQEAREVSKRFSAAKVGAQWNDLVVKLVASNGNATKIMGG